MKCHVVSLGIVSLLCFSCVDKVALEPGNVKPEALVNVCDNIEDNLFKEYCLATFDLDGDGIVSKLEAAKVSSMDLNGTEIRTLSGIENFPNLQKISCRDCSSLETADLSGNGAMAAIADEAFMGCTSLKAVSFPEYVSIIGKSAFKNCTSLDEVKLGKRVVSIRQEAFSGCTSLSSIVFPESVKEIMGAAFKDCSSLAEVVLGKNVASIGVEAFKNCQSLKLVACFRTTPGFLARDAFESANEELAILVPSISGYVDSISNWDLYAEYMCELPDDYQAYKTWLGTWAASSKKSFIVASSTAEITDDQCEIHGIKIAPAAERNTYAITAYGMPQACKGMVGKDGNLQILQTRMAGGYEDAALGTCDLLFTGSYQESGKIASLEYRANEQLTLCSVILDSNKRTARAVSEYAKIPSGFVSFKSIGWCAVANDGDTAGQTIHLGSTSLPVLPAIWTRE